MNIKAGSVMLPFRKPENLYNNAWLLLISLLMISSVAGDRIIFEAGGLIVAFLLLDYKAKLLFSISFLAFSFVYPDSFLANTILVYYFLSLNSVTRVDKVHISKVVKLVTCFVMVFVVFQSIGQILQGYNRPIGVFNGPLALGYFLVASCLITFPSSGWLSYLRFPIPLISGSRSATFLLAPLLLGQWRKSLAIFFLGAVLIFPFLDSDFSWINRAIRFNIISDNIRISSWLSFFDLDWGVFSFLFGFGRANFGSLGYSMGGQNIIVIESSIIQLFAAFGFVFTSIWLSCFLIFVLIRRDLMFGFFLFVSLVSVFHDSLAVLVFVIIAFRYIRSERIVNG